MVQQLTVFTFYSYTVLIVVHLANAQILQWMWYKNMFMLMCTVKIQQQKNCAHIEKTLCVSIRFSRLMQEV